MPSNAIHMLLALSGVLLFFSCSDSTEPTPPEVCGDASLPLYMFCNGKCSYDGKWLAYTPFDSGELYLLSLETLNQQKIPVLNLPENVRPWVIYTYHWCPYNTELLLIDMLTKTDTIGDGVKYVTGQNSYIINIDGTVMRRVTPATYPESGAPMLAYSTDAWLPGSSAKVDSLLMGKTIYIPQETKTIPARMTPLAVSADGKYWCGYSDSFPQDVLKLNGHRIHFEGFDGILTGNWDGYLEQYACFSPSGKYLALNGPNSTQIRLPNTPNIWIIDATEFLANPNDPAPLVLEINFREQYCKYTILPDPVFLTDSTLAVSLFSSDDNVSHYFEIDLQGNIIRKLSTSL